MLDETYLTLVNDSLGKYQELEEMSTLQTILDKV